MKRIDATGWSSMSQTVNDLHRYGRDCRFDEARIMHVTRTTIDRQKSFSKNRLASTDIVYEDSDGTRWLNFSRLKRISCFSLSLSLSLYSWRGSIWSIESRNVDSFTKAGCEISCYVVHTPRKENLGFLCTKSDATTNVEPTSPLYIARRVHALQVINKIHLGRVTRLENWRAKPQRYLSRWQKFFSPREYHGSRHQSISTLVVHLRSYWVRTLAHFEIPLASLWRLLRLRWLSLKQVWKYLI